MGEYKSDWPVRNVPCSKQRFRDSILNTSRYFHVTEGLPPDCMHDILEGTLQFVIKELLRSLIAKKHISLEEVNQRIQLFAYDPCDGINKPSPISISSTDHSLRQSGSYMYCSVYMIIFV